MPMHRPSISAFLCTLCLAQPLALHAAQWSDSEIQFLHGESFREPFNPESVTKNLVTIQNASGYEFGRSFFFVDLLKSDSKDDNAKEAYGEGYVSASLSKLSGRSLAAGPVKDVSLTGGINYGHKSYSGHNVNPRVLLPGVTVDLDLPGFAYFNVDVLAYVDRGRFAGEDNGCHATTYQITPVWKLPFGIGSAKFSVDGFADFIGAHGNCASQVLTQTQIRWDLGNHFGKPEKVFLGIEYQYWKNKFGVEGVKESFPQALLVWKL